MTTTTSTSDEIQRCHRTECEKCGHPLRDGDETYYPDCGQIEVNEQD